MTLVFLPCRLSTHRGPTVSEHEECYAPWGAAAAPCCFPHLVFSSPLPYPLIVAPPLPAMKGHQIPVGSALETPDCFGESESTEVLQS